MTSTIKVDTISENTSANGVAVDGVTLKDGNVFGASDLNLQSSDGNEKITLDASGTQRFNVAGSEGMRLTTAGLGIGTSSPSSFNSQARNLVVGSGSGANGLTIYSGNDSSGNIFFADGTSGDDPTRGGITYKHNDNSMLFRINDSNKMSINTSGNIGIGTESPSTKLTIDEGGEPPAEGMLLLQANSSSRQLRIQPPTNSDNGFIDYRGGNLAFLDDGTEVARFQGSTVLIGKTSSSFSTVGQEFRSGGVTILGRSGGEPLNLNRTSSDGGILNFKKDNTLRGSIGSGNGSLYITEATYGGISFSSVAAGDLTPCTPTGGARDNVMSLGQPSARFKDLYLSQGAFIGGTGTANQLDDYEEGTWTVPSGAVNGITYSVASVAGATYTKIGRQVTLNAQVTFGGHTSDGNQTYLGTLPFTPLSGGVFVGKVQSTADITGCCVEINGGESFIRLMKDSGGSYDYVSRAESASETFAFTISYLV